MRLIPSQESLQHEFKSDLRRLPLRNLVDAVVCMANGPGGTIYLGVEDNGRISGLHPAHKDLALLQQQVYYQCRPHLSVQIRPCMIEGLVIACIEVPLSPVPVATQDGRYKRRQLQHRNGEPQCIAFRPPRHQPKPSSANASGTAASELPTAKSCLPHLRQKQAHYLPTCCPNNILPNQ